MDTCHLSNGIIEVHYQIVNSFKNVGPIMRIDSSGRLAAYGIVEMGLVGCFLYKGDTVYFETLFPDMIFSYKTSEPDKDSIYRKSAVGYGGYWHWCNYENTDQLRYFSCFSDSFGTYVKYFYRSGELEKEGYIRNAKLSGIWKFYSIEGILIREENFLE